MVNRVFLLGNVCNEPQVKNLESGVTVANFTLATNEFYKDKLTKEKKEEATFHNLVLWRSVAESVESSQLKKGDKIFCQGKIRNKKYTDKNGVEKNSTEIVVDTFTIISRKKVPTTTPLESNITEEHF